jgi:hypothetical protein
MRRPWCFFRPVHVDPGATVDEVLSVLVAGQLGEQVLVSDDARFLACICKGCCRRPESSVLRGDLENVDHVAGNGSASRASRFGSRRGGNCICNILGRLCYNPLKSLILPLDLHRVFLSVDRLVAEAAIV